MHNDLLQWLAIGVGVIIGLRMINTLLGYGRRQDQPEEPKPKIAPTLRERYVDDAINMDIDDYLKKWGGKEIPDRERKANPSTIVETDTDKVQDLMYSMMFPNNDDKEVKEDVPKIGTEANAGVRHHMVSFDAEGPLFKMNMTTGTAFITNHGPADVMVHLDNGRCETILKANAGLQLPADCRFISLSNISPVSGTCTISMASTGISLQKNNSGGQS